MLTQIQDIQDEIGESSTESVIKLLTYISVFGAIWYHYILNFFVLFFFCSMENCLKILKIYEG